MQVLDLNLKAVFPKKIETVWQALTNPDELAQWFMPCDFKPEIGHQFTIRGTPTEDWRGFTECRVIAMEPPRFMTWEWRSTELDAPTLVTFELSATEGGTRLTLTHHGTTTSPDRSSLSQGWPEKLRHLSSYLGHGSEDI